MSAEYDALSGGNYATVEQLEDLKVQHDLTRALLNRAVRSMGQLADQHTSLTRLMETLSKDSQRQDDQILRLRWHVLGLWVSVIVLFLAVILLSAAR